MRDFKQHMNLRFSPEISLKKILVAVSGGLDSMVLCHLLLQHDFLFGMAHVNFGLRAEESDADADFVKNWASQNGIPYYEQCFDTKQFATDKKFSIQEAARVLRYEWFEEIRTDFHYDYIATAHHADDNLETFLMHLNRSSGVHGLLGIPEQNGVIIRPLREFSREELLDYADSNHIKWREDSSNSTLKYVRNQLRLEVIPKLKEILPNIEKSLIQSQKFLKETAEMAQDAAILVYNQVAEEFENETRFSIEQLLRLPNYSSYLYTWLEPFGFDSWNDIYALPQAQSGKRIESKTHVLLKDRFHLILFPIQNKNENSVWIENFHESVNFPVNLTFQTTSEITHHTNTSIFVDAATLDFPLEIRHWKEGDYFLPKGMDGQTKKLSKYFKDEKLSLKDKDEIWLLLSDSKIVWIIGKRADERFKVTANTTNIIRIDTNL